MPAPGERDNACVLQIGDAKDAHGRPGARERAAYQLRLQGSAARRDMAFPSRARCDRVGSRAAARPTPLRGHPPAAIVVSPGFDAEPSVSRRDLAVARRKTANGVELVAQ